jgi:uncharacterized protein (TIGR00369 family)
MKTINNPYEKLDGHKCFGCSKKNNSGLHMEFYEDGDTVVCDWLPKSEFQGYYDVLHGGIQATLMDEIASWLVQIKIHTSGVTTNLSVRYLKSVPSNKGKIKLIASLANKRRNLVDVHVELFNPDNELCARSEITYFTYPPEVAKKKLNFPDKEEFYLNKK